MECAAFARENACDFVVALGGGSVLDASKAIAFMSTNPDDLWDYITIFALFVCVTYHLLNALKRKKEIIK